MLVSPTEFLSLILFKDSERGSTLTLAATTAVRLMEMLRRRYPLIHLRMGMARGFLDREMLQISSWGLTESVLIEAISLAERASEHQILVDPLSCKALTKVLPTVAQDGALGLMSTPGISAVDLSHNVIPSLRSSSVSIPTYGPLMHKLGSAFEGLSEGNQGVAMLLTGPDGVGKSFSLSQAREVASRRGVPVLECALHANLIDRPFRPLLDIIDQLLGEGGKEPSSGLGRPAMMRAKLAEFELDEETVDVLVEQYFSGTVEDPWLFLTSSRGIPYESVARALYVLPPKQRQIMFTAALRGLLGWVTLTGSAVLLIEDIDRADAGTRACLQGLVQLTREAPLILIATARQATGALAEGFEKIELSPVEEEGVESLWLSFEQIEGVAGLDAWPSPELTKDLRSACGGMPLYLKLWRQAPLDTPPASLEGLVTAQFGQLPEGLRRLLVIAAVVGEYFEASVLEGLFPQSRSLVTALSGAASSGWLERCPHDPTLWRFTSPILHRVIYALISEEERRHYHRNVFEGLRRATCSTRQELLETIHAHLGGLNDEVVSRAVSLGDRFSVAGDVEGGARWYAIALQHAASESTLLKAALVAMVGPSPLFAQALLDGSSLKGEGRMRGALLRTRALLRVGEASRAKACALGVLDKAKAFPHLQTALLIEAAEANTQLGEPRQALLLLGRAMELLDEVEVFPDDLREVRWRCASVLGFARAQAGDLDGAEQAFEEALRLTYEERDESGLIRALCRASSSLLRIKRPELIKRQSRALFEDESWSLRLPHQITLWNAFAWAQWVAGNKGAARGSFAFAQRLARVAGWSEAVESLAISSEGNDTLPVPQRWGFGILGQSTSG